MNKKSLFCPGCGHPMQSVDHAVSYCASCQLCWLDNRRGEPVSRDGWRRLHQQMATATNAAAPLPESLACVHCPSQLEAAHDAAFPARIAFREYPQGHGQLLSFALLLERMNGSIRAQQFDAAFAAVDILQIRCRSCGAALDITAEDACLHCRAPLPLVQHDTALRILADYDSGALKPVQRKPFRAADINYGEPERRQYDMLKSWMFGLFVLFWVGVVVAFIHFYS